MTMHIEPKAAFTPSSSTTSVLNKTVIVDGLSIFYREAGNPTAPKLVLLHGFPASSHQYRNLIPALAARFHVIAPDYPGFGNSDMPDPATFSYTFDKTSEIVEAFLEKVGFTRFGLFVQDYGGPVGFRIVSRHPEWLEWLIIQNTNAYEVGFASVWVAIPTKAPVCNGIMPPGDSGIMAPPCNGMIPPGRRVRCPRPVPSRSRTSCGGNANFKRRGLLYGCPE
jgi:pimeloyl-ACP methyl ester carboxylesterase